MARQSFSERTPYSLMPRKVVQPVTLDADLPGRRDYWVALIDKGGPTRVRYVVLAFACALSMVTYLDRACFGAAAPQLASELGLEGVASLKWAFTAFAIAYAIFEVPSGWLGDAWGPRSTLLRIVVWWSVCTALTAVIGLRLGAITLGGLGTLIALRFLFGAGEAGAYPNITRALHNWFPPHSFATAQGWVWMSGRLMGGLTPLAWAILVPSLGLSWRVAFVLFGTLGLFWCAGFAATFRNHPTEHPRVNDAEQALIECDSQTASTHGGTPWRYFLRSGNLWLLCLMYFGMAYGWYFNITYLHSYVHDRFAIEDGSMIGALCKGGPLWVGAIGCLAGGVFVDWLARRMGDRRKARRLLGMTTLTVCALCWFAAINATSAGWFFVAISAAALANDMTLASAWATCQDIGQRHAAVTAACMNTIGTLGAAMAGWLTGTLVESSLARYATSLNIAATELSLAQKHVAILPGFEWSFVSYAIVYLLAAICWRFIDPTKPIVPAEAPIAE